MISEAITSAVYALVEARYRKEWWPCPSLEDTCNICEAFLEVMEASQKIQEAKGETNGFDFAWAYMGIDKIHIWERWDMKELEK